MSALFTADLHQTDLPRDEYRWGLFPWLAEMARKHKVKRVIIGGDLTDAKDKHSAILTNRMVDGLEEVSAAAQTDIYGGNHDWIDEAHPFFGFVKRLPNIRFLLEPTGMDSEMGKLLFLPNTRDYQTAWKGLNFKKYAHIFCHQAFDGVLSENGTKLGGIPPSVFDGIKGRVWSGDIHTRQRVGKHIEYVGAPYRIRFGDDFTPRVLLIRDDGTTKDLHFPCMMKHLVSVQGDDPVMLFKKELKRLDVSEGDQVKLRVALPRSEYPTWPEMRKALVASAEKHGVELFGPELSAIKVAASKKKETRQDASGQATPLKLLESYAKREGVPAPLLAAGKAFISG